MKTEPLKNNWATELAPENRPSVETLKAVNELVMNSTFDSPPGAAVSDEKAVELEQYRLERTPEQSVSYPPLLSLQNTEATIAEMVYFLRPSGVQV